MTFVHVGEEREVAELALRERVELGRSVLRRVELAEHEREHRHVGKVVERYAVEVEIAVGVGDAARGDAVATSP